MKHKLTLLISVVSTTPAFAAPYTTAIDATTYGSADSTIPNATWHADSFAGYAFLSSADGTRT